MIVLFHEVYLFVQSAFHWLWKTDRDHDDSDGPIIDLFTKKVDRELTSSHHSDKQSASRRLFKDEKFSRNDIEEELIVPELSNDQFMSHVPHQKYDDTLNFPFLVDKATISHIKKSKVMFLMRGVSGSGKSTIVNKILKIYGDVPVCSADHYFMKNGEYNFDRTQLSVAHDECGEKAKKACMNNVHVAVIDNTNVKRWEMVTYLDLAIQNNYPVIIVRPKTSWGNDPEKLAELNKHGVTADIISKKLRSFEEVKPLYYGWFLDEQHADLLYQLGRKGLEECYRLFPEFKDILLLKSPDLFQAIEKELADCVAKCTEWYGRHFPELRHIIPNDLIYARVVKKIGHRRNVRTTHLVNILPKERVKQVEVAAESSMGMDLSDEDISLISDLCEQIIELKEYRDQLEGFLRDPLSQNSPKLTSPVREVVGPLLLSYSNMLESQMYDNFRLNSNRGLHCTAKFMGTRRNPAAGSDTYPNKDMVQRSYGSVNSFSVTRITVTPRTIGAKVKLSKHCMKLYDKPQEMERIERGDKSVENGCAAHVTIGTAAGIPPVQTNEDLLDILEQEFQCKLQNSECLSYPCSIGTISHVGRDLFVIDLESPITMEGIFTGFYGGNFGSPQRK